MRRCANCGYEEAEFRGRSNPQNKYFHGQVLPIIADYTGYTISEAKDLVKSMFLRKEYMITTKSGVKEVAAVRGSAELSTAEFEKFMADIRQWASRDLGIFIPEPNQHPVIV